MSAEIIKIINLPRTKSLKSTRLGEIPAVVASHVIISLLRFYIHETGWEYWERKAKHEEELNTPENLSYIRDFNNQINQK